MSNTTSFDHPQHGSYQDPSAVVADDKLSAQDKKTVLNEWKQSLDHILANDPHAEQAKDTRAKIDLAESNL